jgi:hypothetical protein
MPLAVDAILATLCDMDVLIKEDADATEEDICA